MRYELVQSEIVPGLTIFKNQPFYDERGSFTETYKFSDISGVSEELKNFQVKQASLSKSKCGVIRGIHAEPWDKFVTITKGQVFIAIVDLRPGETYGNVHKDIIEEGWSFFVPQGCGNSFQALKDTDYFYMVGAEWYPDAKYTMVHFADSTLNIEWPIQDWIVSEKDLNHPPFQKPA